jgi:hypothetical protein
MTLEDLQKLKTISEDQLTINEENILTKSLNLPLYYQQYSQIYVKELKLLKVLSLDKDKLFGELYHHYKFKSDFSLDTKGEIVTYIQADQKYYDKCLEVSNQEVVCKFIEQLLDNINKTGYSIKNYIELKKMKEGLF